MAKQQTTWVDRFLEAPPPELDEAPFDAIDLACMLGMAVAWNTTPPLGVLMTGLTIAQRIGRRNPRTAAQLLALADHNPIVAKLLPGVHEQEQQATPAATRRTNGDLSDLIKKTAPSEESPQPQQKPARNWLKLINDDINLVPHLAVVGATGSGKTTLMSGILHTREGRICIISAKPDDDWGGLPYISIDDDLTFTTAEQALVNVNLELLKRQKQRKRERQAGIPNTLSPITIVLDDFAQLRKACKSADDVVLNLARLGRSVRMRLVLMTYAWQVRELGLEGLGESREHFALIKTKRTKTDPIQRTATMEFDDAIYQLETAHLIKQTSGLRFETGRWWEPLPKPVEAKVSSVSGDIDLLAGLLGRQIMQDERSPQTSSPSERSDARSARSNTVQERSNVQTNTEHAPTHTPTNALNAPSTNAEQPPTPEELHKLMRAFALHAQSKNKQRALETAFGVKKGGSPIYQRASRLFDSYLPHRRQRLGMTPHRIAVTLESHQDSSAPGRKEANHADTSL
ncbi:MAG: hypothetical protein HC828_07650 [Blastochloris sp.]|nr:hypothetical protein [Blastochloris sp.]